MSDQPNADAAVTDAPVNDTTIDQPKPTETVEFWKQKSRENESRAKANADAAKRLAAIEDAAKSETEKSVERIKALEGQVASAQRDAVRFKVASKYGIDGDMADLLLTGTDEDTLTKQAEAIKQESDTRKKNANHVPREGANPQPAGDETREFARRLFAKGD